VEHGDKEDPASVSDEERVARMKRLFNQRARPAPAGGLLTA
jgi:hypothetical protein